MKLPHLLRVDQGPEVFAPLLAAARELGLRAGWLVWSGQATVPGELAAAVAAGTPKAVAVGPRASLVVKTRRGPAVLADVLREHFTGHRLVLVAGEAPSGLPRLQAAADGYRVERGDGTVGGPWDAADLAALLRRPRPWGGARIAEEPPSPAPGDG